MDESQRKTCIPTVVTSWPLVSIWWLMHLCFKMIYPIATASFQLAKDGMATDKTLLSESVCIDHFKGFSLINN